MPKYTDDALGTAITEGDTVAFRPSSAQFPPGAKLPHLMEGTIERCNRKSAYVRYKWGGKSFTQPTLCTRLVKVANQHTQEA